jgi:XapX domain-containing protein
LAVVERSVYAPGPTAFAGGGRGTGMDILLVTLALSIGVLTGAIFAFLQVPIPAPPELPGLLGIVGIYLGYKLIEWGGWGFDLLGRLGVS